MSYLNTSEIVANYAMSRRLTACAASEGERDPERWVAENAWVLCAQPGWAAAWASALAADPEADPGMNEAVITDGQILAAVQSVQEALAPEDPVV